MVDVLVVEVLLVVLSGAVVSSGALSSGLQLALQQARAHRLSQKSGRNFCGIKCPEVTVWNGLATHEADYWIHLWHNIPLASHGELDKVKWPHGSNW